MIDFEPWLKYPGLTRERLSSVAVVMRQVRDNAVLLHDPAGGDSQWSLGCRVYARTCFTLREFAKKHDWLAVVEENEALRFTFSIGRVPLKFYRGDVEDAPGHCRVISEAESIARQLLLDLDGIAVEDRLLRLVVAVSGDGQTQSVTLTELEKGGALTGKFVIPFDEEFADTRTILPPGVDPGPPPIQPRDRISNEEENRDKRKERNVR
jgi:hypothetical protein